MLPSSLLHAPGFPSPPAGKTGWPWTVETPPFEAPDGAVLPKISIVTPSYNQGPFLEETIRSILLQGYPNLEYIVIDGGSNDESVEILKKYSPWLTYWCSEKDSGQPDAINKGLRRSTGDIVAYLNSDDWYHPGAVAAVVERFLHHPGERWWVGWVDDVRGQAKERKVSCATTIDRYIGKREAIYQPGTFWHSNAISQLGLFDADLHFVFDHDFFVRMLLAGIFPVSLEIPIAHFRLHESSKTCNALRLFMLENREVLRRYRSSLSATQWRNACAFLNDFEADYLIDTAYMLMRRKQRWASIMYLLSRVSVWPHLTHPRMVLGALMRAVTVGRPPAWFGRGKMIGTTGVTPPAHRSQ